MAPTQDQQVTAIGGGQPVLWDRGITYIDSCTTNIIISGEGDNLGKPASFNKKYNAFMHEMKVFSGVSFTIKPYKITSGPEKGTIVLKLVPMGAFRLLDLPREIRNMIYKFLILSGNTVQLGTTTTASDYDPIMFGIARPHHTKRRILASHRSHEAASLLAVNKQISAEVVELLYGGNRFEFQTASLLKTFTKLNRNYIHVRDLKINPQNDKNFRQFMSSLPRFSALRSVEFHHEVFCDKAESKEANRATYFTQEAEEFVDGCVPFLNVIKRRLQADERAEGQMLEAIKISDCICTRCKRRKKRKTNRPALFDECTEKCATFQERFPVEVKKIIARRFGIQ